MQSTNSDLEKIPNMKILLKRDNAFKLFRNLNTAVLNNYVRLKNHFRDVEPATHQILNHFKTWKEPLEETINNEICKILQCEDLPEEIHQSVVIAKIIQNYKQEQQFIELFRGFSSSIETIKDFIRTNGLKDTSKDMPVN